MDPNQQNNQQQNNQQQTDPAQQTQPAGVDVGNTITAQQPQQPVTISIGDGFGTMTGVAMGSTTVQQPEQPIPAQQPLDSIIQQLQVQNAALMQQNEALNAQVVKLINGGAQVNTQQQQQPTPVQQMPAQVQQMLSMGAQPDPLGAINPPSLADGHDWSMEGLAGEIGGGR